VEFDENRALLRMRVVSFAGGRIRMETDRGEMKFLLFTVRVNALAFGSAN